MIHAPVLHIVFRTDASREMGQGHLSRCLTLAEGLRDSGARVSFITRQLASPLALKIQEKRLGLFNLPSTDSDEIRDARETLEIVRSIGGIDLLVVDHYGLGLGYQRFARQSVPRLAVVDDHASNMLIADLILNPNLFVTPEAYAGLAPKDCSILCGARYVVLRPEISEIRKHARPRTSFRDALIFFGSSDIGNETMKFLRALPDPMPFDSLTVVAGGANPHLRELRQALENFPDARLRVDAADMGRLMAQADISFGAAGVTLWEKVSLGLPSVVATTGDNQETHARRCDTAGLAVYLGQATRMTEADWKAFFAEVLPDDARWRAMSEACLAAIDPGSIGNATEILLATAAGKTGGPRAD